MKLPGRAWLQFEVEPVRDAYGGTASRLTQTAYYEPKGLAGVAYWYALVPVHPFIFRGMIEEVARRAERRARKGDALEDWTGEVLPS